MEAIAGKWAQLDPEAAIQFMTIRVIRGQRQNGLAEFLTSWRVKILWLRSL